MGNPNPSKNTTNKSLNEGKTFAENGKTMPNKDQSQTPPPPPPSKK